MSSQRRTPRGGPGGSKRPGSRTSRADRRTPRDRPTTSDETRSGPAAAATALPSTTPVRARHRFTGRAAVLVLVLAVLTVSYASSLRAYLQQRQHIGELKTAIAERETAINALEREKKRWDDPAFVKDQARARFGFLMPGETGYQVLDENGDPLETQTSLGDPDEVPKTVPTAWWSQAWASVELAGNPPPPKERPVTEIDGVAHR